MLDVWVEGPRWVRSTGTVIVCEGRGVHPAAVLDDVGRLCCAEGGQLGREPVRQAVSLGAPKLDLSGRLSGRAGAVYRGIQMKSGVKVEGRRVVDLGM
jgi:hypothetical protein